MVAHTQPRLASFSDISEPFKRIEDPEERVVRLPGAAGDVFAAPRIRNGIIRVARSESQKPFNRAGGAAKGPPARVTMEPQLVRVVLDGSRHATSALLQGGSAPWR